MLHVTCKLGTGVDIDGRRAGKKVEDTEYASSRREADGEDEAPTALTSQGVTSGEDKEGEDSSFGNEGKWGLGGRVLRLERTR